MKIKSASVAFLLLFSSLLCAAEPSQQTEDSKDDFSWQFMLGMSAVSDPTILTGVEQNDVDDYLALSLILDVYYKGFFIQANHRRAGGLHFGSELGYQLENNDKWALDIIAKTYIPGYSPKELIEDQPTPIPVMEGLDNRSIGNGLALRYSHFNKNALLTVDLATLQATSAADGWLIETFYSHLIPYKNWDIYLGAGLTYYSKEVTDYYTGIDKDEVSPIRPAYKAGDSLLAQVEVYTQYPLSKHWTFNAGITQNMYSANITASPLVEHQNLTEILVGLIYVF